MGICVCVIWVTSHSLTTYLSPPKSKVDVTSGDKFQRHFDPVARSDTGVEMVVARFNSVGGYSDVNWYAGFRVEIVTVCNIKFNLTI